MWAIDNRRLTYVRFGITENLPLGVEWVHVPGWCFLSNNDKVHSVKPDVHLPLVAQHCFYFACKSLEPYCAKILAHSKCSEIVGLVILPIVIKP